MFANPDLLLDHFGADEGWTESRFKRLIGDVNGDGYNDIVAVSTSGTFVSYGAAHGSFSAPVNLSFVTSPSSLFGTIELADVNGDGRADLVTFSAETVNVALGKTDGTFERYYAGTGNFTYFRGYQDLDKTPVLLGDINGDGRADIIGFEDSGTSIALAGAGGSQPAFGAKVHALDNFGSADGWTSDNTYHRTVADVNGDGRDDIIGFGYAGVWVSLSKGDGTFSPTTFGLDNFGVYQGWSTQDKFPRVAADVNGDGKADIVGFGIKGVYVALGYGDGTFSDPVLDVTNFTARQGWTSDAVYHRTLADIDNDGKIDIVGFGWAGVLAGINDGGHFLA